MAEDKIEHQEGVTHTVSVHSAVDPAHLCTNRRHLVRERRVLCLGYQLSRESSGRGTR